MGLYSLFPKKEATPTRSPPPAPVLEKASTALILNDETSPANTISRESVAPSVISTMANLKFEIMTNFLSQEQLKRKWVRDFDSDREGCFIRKAPTKYVTYPPTMAESGSVLATAIAALNPQVCASTINSILEADYLRCAMTVTSGTIETFLDYHPDATAVPLDDKGLSVQVVPTLSDLSRAQKMQYAAFIASERLLVVWDDDPLHIVGRAENIEKNLATLVWNGEKELGGTEGDMPQVSVIEIDAETGQIMPQYRQTYLMNTVLVALTLALITTVLGAGYREVAIEIAVDKNYIRLAFIALTPVQIFFTLV